MNTRYRLVRFLLIFVAFVNLIVLPGVFISWEFAAALLKRSTFGVKEIPEHLYPIIEYWLVAACTYAAVMGYLCLVAGINPTKYRVIIPILGYGWIFMGLICGWHGFRLQIPPYPLYADLGLCLIPGPLIVWLAKRI